MSNTLLRLMQAYLFIFDEFLTTKGVPIIGDPFLLFIIISKYIFLHKINMSYIISVYRHILFKHS